MKRYWSFGFFFLFYYSFIFSAYVKIHSFIWINLFWIKFETVFDSKKKMGKADQDIIDGSSFENDITAMQNVMFHELFSFLVLWKGVYHHICDCDAAGPREMLFLEMCISFFIQCFDVLYTFMTLFRHLKCVWCGFFFNFI